MAQTRYANYAGDVREPDLATFVRICRVLGIRPDLVLGFVPDEPASEDDEMRQTLGALAQALSGGDLRTVVKVAKALAAYGQQAT